MSRVYDDLNYDSLPFSAAKIKKMFGASAVKMTKTLFKSLLEAGRPFTIQAFDHHDDHDLQTFQVLKVTKQHPRFLNVKRSANNYDHDMNPRGITYVLYEDRGMATPMYRKTVTPGQLRRWTAEDVDYALSGDVNQIITWVKTASNLGRTATTIQSAFRGHLARKRYQQLREQHYAPGGRGAQHAINRLHRMSISARPQQPPLQYTRT